jgi:hypothetical protein
VFHGKLWLAANLMLSNIDKSRNTDALGSLSDALPHSLIDRSVRQARIYILEPLPNDLARIIYLASLRDYNSGMYLHPDLSQQYEISVAHRALQACHREIFCRLLEIRICEYVQQLKIYIRYAGAEERLLIDTWESLKAYRAAIPTDALPLARELFYLQIDSALAILKALR